ncbi:hypothetical protein V8F33_012554 [Rhypophila sp. PSN 637]
MGKHANMATQRNRIAELKPVTLGIDIGSVSSRAYLWCTTTDTRVPVSNPSRLCTLLSSTRYEKGDFPSTCYPFDDNGPVYPNPDKDTSTFYPDRQSTSLKYAPYILVNSSDSFLKQYMLFEALIERRRDAVFRDRLRRGLEGLFSCIAAQVEKNCKTNKFKIAEIALTLPAQWDLEFEDLYSDIVSEVFGAQRSNIYFCTETEALANFVIRDHLEHLEEYNSCNSILFLDYGGHNMNGCLFEVVTGGDGHQCFYRIGSPFGAGGGSEQWEDNILRLCIPLFEDRHRMRMTPKHKQALLDDFNRAKPTVDIGLGANNDDTVLAVKENGRIWDIILTKEKVDKAWEDAHKGPLALAADRIAQLANRKGAFVVVSGGTGRHQALRKRLTEMCQEANLPKPFFADELNPTYGTTIIAQGAAYAVGSRITTHQFFQRGASIGLQMKQGTDNPEGFWDDTATFLKDINRQEIVELEAQDDGDELRLLCDPCFSKSEDRENLYYTNCYILLTLGKLPSGKWRFQCRLEGEGNNMVLILDQSRKVFRRYRRLRYIMNRPAGWTQPFRWKKVVTYRLPLYFDAGANCVHVGVRGRSISELGLEVPEQDTGLVEEQDEEQEEGDETILEAQLQQQQEGSVGVRAESEEAGRRWMEGSVERLWPHAGAERTVSQRIVERGIDPFEKRKTASWASADRNCPSSSSSRTSEGWKEMDGMIWQGDLW